MFGYTEEEMQTLAMPLIVAEESKEDAERHFMAVQSGGSADGEFILKRKDGSRFWARVTACRLTDSSFIAYKQDITDRKEYEKELRIARRKANSANQAKSMFLANMSHEIRTPLNAIVAMSNVLRFTSLTDEQLEYLENIDLSVDSLLALISDVLDISSIEAGRVQLEESPFSLKRCMGAIIRLKKPQILEKGLDISINMPENFPDSVCGDQLKLKQILFNLLGNAIKYTDTGCITLDLSQTAYAEGVAMIRVTVSDTGTGIAGELLPLVFEPFNQAGSSRVSRSGGIGLGLAICRQLAELMGGRIWADSIPGVGSNFYVELPFTMLLAEKSQAVPCKTSRCSIASGKPLTILVAEDEPTNLKAIEYLLKKLGHSTVSATDGRMAVDIWNKGGIDLVMMDICMPEMGGIEALKGIRAAERASEKSCTPVIAITADVSRGVKEQLFMEGFDGYLFKPYDMEQILDMLDSVTGGHLQ